MSFVDKIKNKSIGFYVALCATVLALIVMILYIAFGASSQTFAGGIFVCLLFGVLLGAASLILNGNIGDLLKLVSIVLLSIGLGLFIHNSVGDFADFISNIELFGNMDNVGMRVVIIVFNILCILTAIVGTFLKKEKN
ncbi:MAG: hypothetical protein IJX05_05570 [Clostridia bacterium]|nr:hypothetical protein [Clostridia bacterium]